MRMCVAVVQVLLTGERWLARRHLLGRERELAHCAMSVADDTNVTNTRVALVSKPP